MIISLIGFRGTGKSSVGRTVANQIQLAFVDADEEISIRAAKSIRQIFSDEGEAAFRDLESKVVSDWMTSLQDTVIAWGGGVVLRPENRQLIQQSQLTVWLTGSARILHQRIESDSKSGENRPALSDLPAFDEIESQLAIREPIYRSCADLILDTDQLSIDQVAQQIVDRIQE